MEKIDEEFENKVFIVRNPNRKKKTDQYNVRVLQIEDVLNLLQIQKKETAKEIITIIKRLKHYDPLLVKELIKEIKQKYNTKGETNADSKI